MAFVQTAGGVEFALLDSMRTSPVTTIEVKLDKPVTPAQLTDGAR